MNGSARKTRLKFCVLQGDAQPKPAEKGVGWGETLRTRSQGREGSVKAEGVLPVMQWKGGIVAYAILKQIEDSYIKSMWLCGYRGQLLIHGMMVRLSVWAKSDSKYFIDDLQKNIFINNQKLGSRNLTWVAITAKNL